MKRTTYSAVALAVARRNTGRQDNSMRIIISAAVDPECPIIFCFLPVFER
jgi:hypothetical protein